MSKNFFFFLLKNEESFYIILIGKIQNRRNHKSAAVLMKIQNIKIIAMNTATMITTMPVDTIVEELLNSNLQHKSIDLLTYRIE
jgi:hypothetical protein